MMRRLLALLCLIPLVGAVIAVGAAAQDGEELDRPGEAPTFLRSLDNTVTEVGALELMHQGSPDDVTMTQRGQGMAVDSIVPLSEQRAVSVVFVIDTGSTMVDEGGLNAARNGVLAALGNLGPDDRVAIVEAGTVARSLELLTPPGRRVARAVEQMGASPNGQSSVWEGVRVATALLAQDRSDRQPNVVLLTSGDDISDSEARSVAVARLTTAGIPLFVQGWGDDFPAAPFVGAVARAGGALHATPGGDDYADGVATMVGWISSEQYIIQFTPEVTEPGQVLESSLSIDGTSIPFTYVSGNLADGTAALLPVETSERSGLASLPFLQGTTGQILVALLVLLAVAGIIYGLGSIFSPDEGALSNVLQPYSEGFGTEPDSFEDDEDSYAKTALLQRAVGITEQMAERQGYLSRTEGALERADLPLRAGEALFFYVALVALTAVFGLLLLPPMGALLLALVAMLVPVSVVSFAAGKRRRDFQAQLPDTLQLLAGTLRAGYSLMQGVEAVSQEVSEPMGKELRRVVTEARLGRPLEESMDGMAERMSSPDFAWAVMAIRIQREVGGNLSELLLTVADTMVNRERLRRDINSLTAEGRVSAFVLGLLPVGLAIAMFGINPDYMTTLFDTTLGNILVGLALLAMGIGFLWMRQIIKIEV